MKDPFGLEREEKIRASGVREVFTPHQPIQTVDLFFGRQREVQALIEHLNTPGQHALLFGDRGVGKSSLANVASNLLLQHVIKGDLYKKRCDSTDNFTTLFSEPLAAVDVDLNLIESENIKSEGGRAGLGVFGINAGINTATENRSRERGSCEQANSPGWLADKLKGLNGLCLIDEVDSIRNSIDREKLAEVIKHLSDYGSSFKILLVGIAETGSELTAGHPSVDRCLRETRLGRMDDGELRFIIDQGEDKLGLSFSSQAKSRIIKVSSGYPHFTHLLGLKSAEDAIGDDRENISVSEVEEATRRAVDDAEGRLKRVYDEACRSYNTDEYRKVLCAAAVVGQDEFKASALRDSYARMWDESIGQGTLNNYFNRLVSDGYETILRRIAKGVYRFNDPRMPSFIRIANMADTNIEQGTASNGAKAPR